MCINLPDQLKEESWVVVHRNLKMETVKKETLPQKCLTFCFDLG